MQFTVSVSLHPFVLHFDGGCVVVTLLPFILRFVVVLAFDDKCVIHSMQLREEFPVY
jgi:hypothetical protein